MITNIRRIVTALLLALIAAAAAQMASSSAFAEGTGNLTITGGLDHPYLPAAAEYQSDTTTGCDLGYYYGDLFQGLAEGSPVTCFPFTSDFDQNATLTYSTDTLICPTGYQRELAGDGYTSPRFIRCWPFATYGDRATPTSYSSQKDVGCAPGYTMTVFSDDPADQAAACFMTSHTDAPTPQGCTLTIDADNRPLPCVANADGTSSIQYPPTPPTPPTPPLYPISGVTITGDHSSEGTLYAHTGTFPAGTALRYQWRLDGRAITGATASRTFVPARYYSRVISVTITATHAGYLPWVGTSGGIRIAGGHLTNTHASYITGNSYRGHRLYANAGYFYKAGTHYQRVSSVVVTYRWYVDGRPIAGATHSSFVTPYRYRGHVVQVRVTGTKQGFYSWTSVSGRLRIR